MKKFVLIVPLALALLATPVLAAGFTVDIGQVTEVFAEDTSQVTVTIHNGFGGEDLFMISQPLAAPPANKWASMSKGSLSVPAYSDGTFTISITPSADAKAGDYRYEFTVKNQRTGEVVSKEFQISIKQRESAGGVILTPSCQSCKDAVSVSVDAENYGTAVLKDVKVRLSCGTQATELAVGTLNISGGKQLEWNVDITGWKPGDYAVSAELTANGQSLDTQTATFTVPEINNITIHEETQSMPWGKSVIFTIENVGNAAGEAEVNAAVSQSLAVTISYSQPPTVRGDEWTWTKTLQPGEKAEVSYSEFFWPLPIIVVAAALGGLYFYLFFTSVGMKKVVKKKGGDWAIEVSVHNRGKAVEGAIVTDTVPHNFTLSSSFETLKPIVRKMELGTQLIWRIGGIRRGEEKILHYRIAPKIHSGPVRLPAAHLRAKKGEKTIIASTGNAVLAIEKGPPKLSVER